MNDIELNDMLQDAITELRAMDLHSLADAVTIASARLQGCDDAPASERLLIASRDSGIVLAAVS